MKSANDVISTIFSHSKKFKEIRCFRILRSLLPANLRDRIKYFFTKEDRIFIVVETHAMKTEFNHKKDLIKFLLNKIEFEFGLCHEVKTKDIFISISLNKPNIQLTPFVSVSYEEKAFGNFEIKTDNNELKEIFQNIKKTIRT